MKTTILFLFLFVFIEQIDAQWFWQNPLPQGSDLKEVEFINSNVGYAVQYGGPAILKSTNGGTNWFLLYPGIGGDFYSVSFVNESTGYVAGNSGYGTTGSGIILKTINGGLNWVSQTIGTTDLLNSICFLNSSTGYASGGVYWSHGTILKTTDGGNTWSALVNASPNFLKSIFFTDVNTGWVAGDNMIFFKTTDGGSSWNTVNPGLWYSQFKSMFFVNSTTGYFACSERWDEYLLKTADGGDTWEQKPLYSGDINSIFFTDENTGYVATYPGLAKTTDGGDSWEYPFIFGYSLFLGINFIDVNTGWGVGYNGITYKTTDGGDNWLSEWTTQTPNSGGFIDVYFVNSNTGWVNGWNGKIYKTTNSGVNWFPQIGNLNSTLFCNCFIDANTGWMVGEWGRIIKTTNGGNNWFTQNSGINDYLYSVFFMNASTGWISSGNSILKTTNGGDNWISNGSANGMSIYFIDVSTGWVANFGGSIFKTINGGDNWVTQASGLGNLYSICFANAYTGYTVGFDAVIFKTTNSGTNWFSQTSPLVYEEFYSVQCLSPDLVMIAGAAGALSTTNGGLNWISQALYSGGGSLRSLYFVDGNTGWTVGYGGAILKTTNGGWGYSLTVTDKINSLKDQVNNLVSNHTLTTGQGEMLNSKLDGTLQMLNQEHYQNAINRMQQFEFEVNLLVTNHGLQQEIAGTLLSMADEIINMIQNLNNGNAFIPPEKHSFTLGQNYPNPFNPITKIKFEIPYSSYVTMKVYDILGREVATLVNEKLESGSHEVVWNASKYSSGVYFYKLTAGSYTSTKKLVLMK